MHTELCEYIYLYYWIMPLDVECRTCDPAIFGGTLSLIIRAHTININGLTGAL